MGGKRIRVTEKKIGKRKGEREKKRTKRIEWGGGGISNGRGEGSVKGKNTRGVGERREWDPRKENGGKEKER